MYSPHPNLPNKSTPTDTLKRHVRDTHKEVDFVVVEGSRWWWCSSLVRAGNEQHSALSPNIFQRSCLPKRLGALLLGSSQTQSAKKGARQKRAFPAELSRTPCWWLCVWWKSGKILSSPSSVGGKKKSVSKSNQRIDRFFFDQLEVARMHVSFPFLWQSIPMWHRWSTRLCWKHWKVYKVWMQEMVS